MEAAIPDRWCLYSLTFLLDTLCRIPELWQQMAQRMPGFSALLAGQRIHLHQAFFCQTFDLALFIGSIEPGKITFIPKPVAANK